MSTPDTGHVRAQDSVLADMTLREFDAGCLTSGCHAQMVEKRWLHGPVAAKNCAACHEPQGTPAEHLFARTLDGAQLCFSCHQAPDPDQHAHSPYAEELCLDCHDPHGGADKNFITTATVAALCETCHVPGESSFPHTPVAQGDCLACHHPHGSSNDHLLVLNERELCLGCHREYKGLLPENIGGEGVSLANAHEVLVSDGCLVCHQAHGGSHAGLLEQPVRDLCEGCHEDVIRDLPSAQTVHGAFEGDDSCIQCHSPHGSLFDHLLVDSPATLCFECHGEEIALPSGGQVADIRGQLDASAHVHLPVAQGECTTCHRAHFSPQRSLLSLEYPDHIYADFDEEAYALCFQCHDRALASEEHFINTGFRDGDRNLHYVHVNREKGRACDICHRPHGSGYPDLLRSSFRYGPGAWEMPIDYVQQEHGGTCTSACHEVSSYDNSSASGNASQPPPVK